MFSVEFVLDVGRELLAAPGALRHLPHGFKKVYHDAQDRNHRRWAAHPHAVRSVKGFRIQLDGNPDAPLYFNVGVAGVYEPHITSLFRKVLRPGMTVVDVGANVGWYTLLAARRVGPSGRVVACEPGPSNFPVLGANVRLNGFGNVTTVPVAVFDRSGEMPLSLSTTSNGWNSMVQHVGDESVVVRTERLDTLLEQAHVGRVDLLKIDVEGAEPNVLEGAEATLERTDRAVIEWNPSFWKDRDALVGRLFARFDVHAIRYSPNLLRRLGPEELARLPPGNLYLEARSLGRRG